jgi:hypothetical protein
MSYSRTGGPGGGYIHHRAYRKVFIWDGEISKTTTDGTPSHNTATTVSLLSTYIIQHGYTAFDSIPWPPKESINDLILMNEQLRASNEQIYGPSQPLGRSPAEHAIWRGYGSEPWTDDDETDALKSRWVTSYVYTQTPDRGETDAKQVRDTHQTGAKTMTFNTCGHSPPYCRTDWQLDYKIWFSSSPLNEVVTLREGLVTRA